MTIENFLNNIDNQTRLKQIELFFKASNTELTEIGNYILIEFKNIITKEITEYLCVNSNNYNIYKSFYKKDEAINYCLDKINTESSQIKLI